MSEAADFVRLRSTWLTCVLNKNAFSDKHKFASDHIDKKLFKNFLTPVSFLGLTELCKVHLGHEETGVNRPLCSLGRWGEAEPLHENRNSALSLGAKKKKSEFYLRVTERNSLEAKQTIR